MNLAHPDLWPFLLGAVLGALVLILHGRWYARRFPGLSRRRRVVHRAAELIMALIYATGVYACFIEPRTLTAREERIESELWTGAPLRVALISDPHIGGAHMNAARFSRIIERINAGKPDLVLLLGDYIDGHEHRDQRSEAANNNIAQGFAALAQLEAPAFAVIGNHDVWYDEGSIADNFAANGVVVLWNSAAHFESIDGKGVEIVGLEDQDTRDPDFAEAFNGTGPDPAIIISHSPDPFAVMPPEVADRAIIMFAGHTHCGQVRLPFFKTPLPSRYGQRFACRLIEEDGRKLYVTAGIGTSELPLRFRVPPEIVFVTLQRPDTDERLLAAGAADRATSNTR